MICVNCQCENVSDYGSGNYKCRSCGTFFEIIPKKIEGLESTIQEIKTVKELVIKLLEKDDRCKNDDKWLTYRVFSEIAIRHNKNIYIPFELFNLFPAFETVKRCRAFIQNTEKRYLPTDEQVLNRRQNREKIFSTKFKDEAIL